jgi:PAS domain S-box-containing protein
MTSYAQSSQPQATRLQPPTSKPVRAVRRSLIALAACCITAAVALAAERMLDEASRQRQALEEQTRTIARSAAAAVDREIAAAEALLHGLKTSPALRSGDLETFYRQLVGTERPPGTWFILRGNPPDQLLNTLRPYGAPLPDARIGGKDGLKVIQTQATVVTDLVWATLAEQNVVGIGVPVMSGDRVDYVLGVTISAPSLARVFTDLELPAGWRAVLHDSLGNTIATSGPGDAAGPLFKAHQSCKASGWTVVAEVPMAIVDEPLQRALLGITGGGTLLLAGIGVAVWTARRMRFPIDELNAAASAAERSKQEMEARYRAYWEYTREALFLVDVMEDGRFRFDCLNPEHERLTGLTTEAIRGREPSECLPADIADWVTGKYRKCSEAGDAIRYEEELTLPAGKRQWETSLVPIRDPGTGRIVRLLGSARDITERKEAEQALRLGAKRLQLAQEAAGIGTWEWDVATEELYWSAEAYRLFGVDPTVRGSAVYRAWRDILHPDDREQIDAATRAFLSAGRPFALEFRIVRDGEVRWMLGRGKVVHDAMGRPERIIGINLDITDRRIAEDALRKGEARFRAMAETVPDILCTATPQRGCEYMSPRFAQYTGMPSSSHLGMGWAEALHPDDREHVLEARRRAAETGDPFELQCRIRSAGGRYRWFVGRWNPIRDDTGALKWFGAFTDVDDIKQAQEALRGLTAGLLAAQDDERRRIARELHDSTAQNLIGALLAIDRALGQGLDLPSRAASSLRESRELIELSQLEIRTLSYLLHPPLLDEAGLPAAVGWFADGFSTRTGIALDLEIAPELRQRRFPQEVETALYRVLQEGLTNVYRHATVKSAQVRLRYDERGAGSHHHVALEIADAGPGIGTVAARRGAGAAPGVGLASMRERMRQVGGTLVIRSSLTGTTLRADVPVAVATEPPCHTASPHIAARRGGRLG